MKNKQNMKCTITIEDTTEGKATVELTFDPPVNMNSESTTATDLALKLVEYATSLADEARELI